MLNMQPIYIYTINDHLAGESLIIANGYCSVIRGHPSTMEHRLMLTLQARATANSIFGLGIYLGGAFASLGAFVDEQERKDEGATATQQASLV